MSQHGLILKSFFSSFCLPGVSTPLRVTGRQSLPLKLLLSPYPQRDHCSTHHFLVFPNLKDLPGGKPYCLYLMPQGAKLYCVLHKCRRKWSSVKAQRCRLQEFLNGERQQLTFPSTFPGMTLFPARPCSTRLPSQSAPAEEPEHWPA